MVAGLRHGVGRFRKRLQRNLRASGSAEQGFESYGLTPAQRILGVGSKSKLHQQKPTETTSDV